MSRERTNILCLASLAIVLTMLPKSGLQAQRRKPNVRRTATTMSAKQLAEEYKFDQALAATNSQLRTMHDAAEKKRLEEERNKLSTAQSLLPSTADVLIVDSCVVARGDLGKALWASRAKGQTTLSLTDDTLLVNTTFTSSLGDRRIVSLKNGKNERHLCQQQRLGENWSVPIPLDGLNDTLVRNPVCPFLMSDGTTLYFSANGDASIGGTDIFKTTYSQEQGKWLAPENIGFPYNSLADDYLLFIDEQLGLGWMATTRRCKHGQLIVYTFCYDTERRTLSQSLSEQTVRDRARLLSIAATQTGRAADLKTAKNALAQLEKETTASKSDNLCFILSDEKNITSPNQLQSPQAQAAARQWWENQSVLAQLKAQLTQLREEYAAGNAKKRKSMSASIVGLERQVGRAELMADILSKKIRAEENKR